MKGGLKIYDKLPFAVSFRRSTGTPLTNRHIHRHLGNTLHPRLAAIYQNVLEAIVYSNNQYLKKNAVPELADELIRRRDYHKKLGLKFKVNEPHTKLLPLKNYILPERVYRNDNLYISIVARVYFGGQLAQPASYQWPSRFAIFQMGANRFVMWDRELSLWQNMRSWYANQVYEFRVRYQSNLYIRCIDSHNVDAYPRSSKKEEEDLQQDVVASEFVLRSSNDRFDWVLVDVNGIVEGCRDKQ